MLKNKKPHVLRKLAFVLKAAIKGFPWKASYLQRRD
jgi:hypothetical protein